MLTRKAFRVFNTLVVPLDGSELAERALPYAVRFAKKAAGWCSFERPSLRRPVAWIGSADS